MYVRSIGNDTRISMEGVVLYYSLLSWLPIPFARVVQSYCTNTYRQLISESGFQGLIGLGVLEMLPASASDSGIVHRSSVVGRW